MKIVRFNIFINILCIYENNNLIVITRAQKIVIKFDNYSFEIVAFIVIVNSYKNGHNCYQIAKITIYFSKVYKNF